MSKMEQDRNIVTTDRLAWKNAVPFLMIFSDLQGHSVIAGLFKCNILYR